MKRLSYKTLAEQISQQSHGWLYLMPTNGFYQLQEYEGMYKRSIYSHKYGTITECAKAFWQFDEEKLKAFAAKPYFASPEEEQKWLSTRYASVYHYSDVTPLEVSEYNEEKGYALVRELDAELIPFEMVVIPGGFMGHVVNSRQQSYTYTQRVNDPFFKITRRKDGKWYLPNTKQQIIFAANPYKYYDYNF